MLYSIQYLRAFAAFFVLLSHISWKTIQMGYDNFTWAHEAGQFGVDIFFVISGFIMSYTTYNLHQKPGAVGTFLKKRVQRIIPLYWFVSLFALAIYLIMPERVNSGGNTNIISSFLLLPVDVDVFYLVGVGWTLRYEFIFYAIFSIGLLFSRFYGSVIVLLTISTLFALSLAFPMQSIHYVLDSIANNLFLEFAFGMIIYHVWIRIHKVPSMLSLLLVLSGIVYFYLIEQEIMGFGIRSLDTGISAAMICFGMIGLERMLRKYPSRLFKSLGDSSYSLYLIHPFVLAFALLVLQITNIEYTLSLFIVFMILISLISGYLCYVLVEKRLIKYTKKLNPLNKPRKTVN